MIWKFINWLDEVRYWLFGGVCPFCERYAVPCLGHDCPAMRGKSPDQIVAITTEKIRDILKDEPADKLVHGAFEACDGLEKAFPSGASLAGQPTQEK